MAKLNLNFIFDALTELNDWWPIVKSNFQKIQDTVNAHFSGVTDKHKAEDIDYSGDVPNSTNVKAGLDNLKKRVDTIITTPIDSEASAQELAEARGGKNTLGERLDEIQYAGVTQSPSINFGMNTINHMGKTPVFPTISLTGSHIASVLPSGDFSNANVWATAASTKSISSGVCAVTGTGAGMYPQIVQPTNIPIGHKFYKRAYVRITTPHTGSAYIGLALTATTSGTGLALLSNPVVNQWYLLSDVQDTSTMVGNIQIVIHHQYDTAAIATNMVMEVKEVMLLDMGADSNNPFYNKTKAEMDALFPDWKNTGVISLQNPYFENVGKNLFDGIMTKGMYLSYGIPLVGSSDQFYGNNFMRVNSNKTYSLRHFGAATQMFIVWYDKDKNYISTVGVNGAKEMSAISPSKATFARIEFTVNASDYSVDTYKPQFEESDSPTDYEPFSKKAFVINQKLFNDDYVKIEAGKVTGQKYWKEKVLFGKDNDWFMSTNYTSFKSINLYIKDIAANATRYLTKYNGTPIKLIDWGAGYTSGDVSAVNDGLLSISVSSADSGWLDSIAPSNDEVKCFMNGWKAQYTSNGGRYVQFRSVIDNSFPPTTIKTNITAASSTNTITVADTTGFASGDLITIFASDGITVKTHWSVSSVSGNTITFPITMAVVVGDILVKDDNGTTDIKNLTYCKNNIAPFYEGYKFDYKLATPEPITDTNCPIEGNIWALSEGNNHVSIDSGIILNELSKPDLTNGYYRIDSTYLGLFGLTQFKNEEIIAVYRDQIFDTNWSHGRDTNSWGREMAQISQANFNENAIYTIDYRILKTLHAQSFSSLALTFAENIVDSISSNSRAIEGKQRHSSTLDDIVDLSLYERVLNPGGSAIFIGWYTDGSTIYVGAYFPFKVRKKGIPKIKINAATFITKDRYLTSTNGSIVLTKVTVDGVGIQYYTTDANIISLIKANGAYYTTMDIEADCRERV